jgi:hypothetical protein
MLSAFYPSVAAESRGFLAIRDGIKAYRNDLVALFKPPKKRFPFYSTRQTLLRPAYTRYGAYLSQFFGIQPMPGETITADSKGLRGFYTALSNASNS